MTPNLSLFGRILRVLFGILLLTWTFAGGPIWGVLGIVFLATGAWGYSPLYAYLKSRNPRR